MNEPVFGTVSTAMVTPFKKDGEVDYEAAARIANKLVEDGCDCVLVSGTTGESPTTHTPEKAELIRVVKESVGDRAFILAGAGSNDTKHAVRIAEYSAEAGADGLLVVSPYYNRPSQEGLYQHCKAIAQSTPLPVMLYDIPGRTGLAFSDETLDRLAQVDNIKAVKDATGNIEQAQIRLERTGLQYYSGDDGLNFAFLSHGGTGVVSVVGHVAAAEYRKMVTLVKNGDLVGARQITSNLRRLVTAMMGGGQGAVMAKHALVLQGYLEEPTLRLPLVPEPQDKIDELKAAMTELGLLG